MFCVYQAGYATFNVVKYLDTATFKASKELYKTTLPYDMTFIKADESTSNEKVEKLTREFNIHYIACIGSLIHFLSTRVNLRFAVQKLEKFSSNPGKATFKGLVHLLIYIRENKTLVLKYYTDMKYALVSDLLIKASIKTKNKLMSFYDSSL